MISTIVITICLTISLVCAIISITLAIKAYIDVQVLQKSTHAVQYVPMDPQWASSEGDLSQKLQPIAAEPNEPDENSLEDDELDLNKVI